MNYKSILMIAAFALAGMAAGVYAKGLTDGKGITAATP
jgi:hypothetical protein